MRRNVGERKEENRGSSARLALGLPPSPPQAHLRHAKRRHLLQDIRGTCVSAGSCRFRRACKADQTADLSRCGVVPAVRSSSSLTGPLGL